MPATAQLWIFGVDRPLDDVEEQILLATVDRFLSGWKAHGVPLAASREFRDGRFLMVAVDDRIEAPSGCSIDTLVHSLKELERELDVTIVDGASVWYRGPDGIDRRSRSEFRELAARGDVTPDTVVFDTSLTRLDRLRAGEWERPAGDSWHRRVFFRDVTV